MTIRTFQPGDETQQVAVYNEAAKALPGFKPATVHEVLRRVRARGFDPASRYYALQGTEVVGYCGFQPSGRVSYPWCRPGHEQFAEPLFARAIEAAREQGVPALHAAYRTDWTAMHQFFESHAFVKARDMVNFAQDLIDLPTAPGRVGGTVTPVTPTDVPTLLRLGEGVLRLTTLMQLEKHLFRNPYFTERELFALRGKSGEVLACVVLITDSTYADPKVVDPLAPCFRLGAFGTEGLETKRIKGLFSVLARDDGNFPTLVLDALAQASVRLQDFDDISTFAAQVPSDATHLLTFFQRHFRRLGSFPVYERALSS